MKLWIKFFTLADCMCIFMRRREREREGEREREKEREREIISSFRNTAEA